MSSGPTRTVLVTSLEDVGKAGRLGGALKLRDLTASLPLQMMDSKSGISFSRGLFSRDMLVSGRVVKET